MQLCIGLFIVMHTRVVLFFLLLCGIFMPSVVDVSMMDNRTFEHLQQYDNYAMKKQ